MNRQYLKDHPEAYDGTGALRAELKEAGDDTGFPTILLNLYNPEPEALRGISLYIVPEYPKGSSYTKKMAIAERWTRLLNDEICRVAAFRDS